MGESDKLKLPPLGSREVIGHLPVLSGDSSAAGFPLSLTERKPPGRQSYLALDRVPSVPPIHVDRAVAERMWKRPDCKTSEIQYLQQGLTPKQAKKSAEQCRAEIKQYNEEVRVTYQVEIEGVEVTEQAWILKAKLLRATVYGSRNELLKTLAAADFAAAEDTWQGQTELNPEPVRAEETQADASAPILIVSMASMNKPNQYVAIAGSGMSSSDTRRVQDQIGQTISIIPEGEAQAALRVGFGVVVKSDAQFDKLFGTMQRNKLRVETVP